MNLQNRVRLVLAGSVEAVDTGVGAEDATEVAAITVVGFVLTGLSLLITDVDTISDFTGIPPIDAIA